MTEWENPYAELQRSIRAALKHELRRTNGCVSRQEFMECATPGQQDRASKMLLRLLLERDDGLLEWKPEIDTEEALHRKLGGSAAVQFADLAMLWSKSRKLGLRTAFPHLAPSANKSQHVRRRNFGPQPVYGVDFLVRPPTEFADDAPDGRPTRNALSVGEECMALVIQGIFQDDQLMNDGEYFVRIVVGAGLKIRIVIEELIPRYAWRCELALRRPLLDGDVREAVAAALPHLERFAGEATNAFYA